MLPYLGKTCRSFYVYNVLLLRKELTHLLAHLILGPRLQVSGGVFHASVQSFVGSLYVGRPGHYGNHVWGITRYFPFSISITFKHRHKRRKNLTSEYTDFEFYLNILFIHLNHAGGRHNRTIGSENNIQH